MSLEEFSLENFGIYLSVLAAAPFAFLFFEKLVLAIYCWFKKPVYILEYNQDGNDIALVFHSLEELAEFKVDPVKYTQTHTLYKLEQ